MRRVELLWHLNSQAGHDNCTAQQVGWRSLASPLKELVALIKAKSLNFETAEGEKACLIWGCSINSLLEHQGQGNGDEVG